MLNPSLRSAIEALSVQDKLAVFETIRDAVMPVSESGFGELTERQRAELLRRAADAADHPERGSSWSEVKARLAP
ncbi:MAG: addiction module protein [Gammaproteobacteria bacterium]|jgi:putative addiction module component (TIGR02574 family)|nr:addiction module protein [Gammaproteobacteria bacterium]